MDTEIPALPPPGANLAPVQHQKDRLESPGAFWLDLGSRSRPAHMPPLALAAAGKSGRYVVETEQARGWRVESVHGTKPEAIEAEEDLVMSKNNVRVAELYSPESADVVGGYEDELKSVPREVWSWGRNFGLVIGG